MTTLQDQMMEYRFQLKKGSIQAAHRGLMEFISSLRTFFQRNYPEFEVPGNIYQGYMDMTYFSIIPPSLKPRKLKIAVVFVYETFRFEVWLSGYNRQVQAKYWRLLRDNGYEQYQLVDDPLKADSILEHTLVKDPDFSDTAELTQRITSGTRSFIADIETQLATLEI